MDSEKSENVSPTSIEISSPEEKVETFEDISAISQNIDSENIEDREESITEESTTSEPKVSSQSDSEILLQCMSRHGENLISDLEESSPSSELTSSPSISYNSQLPAEQIESTDKALLDLKLEVMSDSNLTTYTSSNTDSNTADFLPELQAEPAIMPNVTNPSAETLPSCSMINIKNNEEKGAIFSQDHHEDTIPVQEFCSESSLSSGRNFDSVVSQQTRKTALKRRRSHSESCSSGAFEETSTSSGNAEDGIRSKVARISISRKRTLSDPSTTEECTFKPIKKAKFESPTEDITETSNSESSSNEPDQV